MLYICSIAKIYSDCIDPSGTLMALNDMRLMSDGTTVTCISENGQIFYKMERGI